MAKRGRAGPERAGETTATRGTASARGVAVILSTAPARVAPRIARALVRERRAACVNVVEGLRSTYRWKGRVESARESLLIVKTTAPGVRACLDRLAALHPYEVPEGLVLRPSQGLATYLAWVAAEAT